MAGSACRTQACQEGHKEKPGRASHGEGGQAEAVAPLGVLCGLLAGLAYSFHYIFSKIYLTRYSAATIYCLSMAVGAVVLLPLVPFAAKTPMDWLAAFRDAVAQAEAEFREAVGADVATVVALGLEGYASGG